MSLIRFLWRWKVFTTAALTERFFGGLSPITAYTRLWHLKKAGFIQLVGDNEGRRFVWSIALKGFSAIQNELPELSESGFKTENAAHDQTKDHRPDGYSRVLRNGKMVTIRHRG